MASLPEEEQSSNRFTLTIVSALPSGLRNDPLGGLPTLLHLIEFGLSAPDLLSQDQKQRLFKQTIIAAAKVLEAEGEAAKVLREHIEKHP